ncbi:glycosyltransferase [Candidatus Falkowbacteria bacterium]|nr:glycosyltransferase [Candidatus Falkowbacteria bacterium]
MKALITANWLIFIITAKPNKKLPVATRLPDGQGCELRVYYLNGLYYNLSKLPKFLRLFWQIWNMFNIINYFKIKKILQKEKCEAVITNNLMGMGFLTARAIKNLKIKHLHIAHDIQLIHPSGLMYYGKEGIIDGFFAKIYSGLCRWLFDSPAAVIFPSRWLKDLYISRKFFVRSKIEVFPNPVEGAARQAGGRAGGFKFLFLGQIEKHKGVFLLIEAFNKINKKYPEVELILAGDGSLIKKAREKATGNSNIKFLGWPGDERADELLGAADCLVYPSLVYENCPNAIQRALAVGLPVLASNLGGIPELLSGGAGALFKPADAGDLAEKIARMIENKNNLGALAEAGKRKAFTFKAENYVKGLEEAIKNR